MIVVIVMLLFMAGIIAFGFGIGYAEDRPDEPWWVSALATGGFFLLIIAIATAGISSEMAGKEKGYTEGYKAGQVDAIEGRIYYSKSTQTLTKWVEHKEPVK